MASTDTNPELIAGVSAIPALLAPELGPREVRGSVFRPSVVDGAAPTAAAGVAGVPELGPKTVRASVLGLRVADGAIAVLSKLPDKDAVLATTAGMVAGPVLYFADIVSDVVVATRAVLVTSPFAFSANAVSVFGSVVAPVVAVVDCSAWGRGAGDTVRGCLNCRAWGVDVWVESCDKAMPV